MSNGLDHRAAIDTETVKGLQFINGGAAAGLMTLLPLVIAKPGLRQFLMGTLGGIICAALGLMLAVIHNHLRRKCSLEYAIDPSRRQRSCRWMPNWVQSVPNEPCICTVSVTTMWLSLIAFGTAVIAVTTGAGRSIASTPVTTAQLHDSELSGRGVGDEVRAQCGRDARVWAGAFVAEFRRTQPNWSSRMNSHYSTRDQRCYAEVWFDSDAQSGADGLFFDSFVFDVDDNRGIGELRQRVPLALGQQPEVLACAVANKKCGTSNEWEALIKPFKDQ
jgi:hypothetical protein